MIKKTFTLIFFLLLFFFLFFAEIPSGYYDSAYGKTTGTLRTALYNIIKDHTVVSYDYLYTVYETSDVTSSGYVWDMYFNCVWTPGEKNAEIIQMFVIVITENTAFRKVGLIKLLL